MKKLFYFIGCLLFCILLNNSVTQGKAADSYIFTIGEFYAESLLIRGDMNVVAEGKVHVITFSSTEQFVNKWNSITEAEFIVVDCHGNNFGIGSSKKNYVDTDDVKSRLYVLKCEVLILLPCNTTAGYENSWDIAHKFKDRVSGNVIASDETVNTRMSFYNLSFNLQIESEGNWWLITKDSMEKLAEKSYKIVGLIAQGTFIAGVTNYNL